MLWILLIIILLHLLLRAGSKALIESSKKQYRLADDVERWIELQKEVDACDEQIKKRVSIARQN